jgi:L-threonylcarbamoyladenylate synthase
MRTLFFKGVDFDIKYINDLLQKGGIIGFPTETVYGLGASISNDAAIRKVYELKKRPLEKALIVHMGKLDQVHFVAEDIPDEFFLLASTFLPGPLTLVLKKKKEISSLVSSLNTIGVRIPSHPVALHLLRGIDEPIIGTSANISHHKSPVSAEEVLDNFDGQIECIIDGGRCDIGVPSTILSLVDGIKILRKGLITPEQIQQVLGREVVLDF